MIVLKDCKYWVLFVNLTMGKQEIKNEINKKIEEIPEEFLAPILDLLNQLQRKDVTDLSLLKNLSKVLLEDDELLKKLAQ